MDVEPVYIDLGPVVGKDAHILPPQADYINNGGDPGVEIISTEVETEEGEPQQVQLLFNFFNLVNDPLSSAQIEAISNDEVVNSSNTLNGTGLTTLWVRIKAKFAALSHKHSASDINSGTFNSDLIGEKTIGTTKIADKAVGTTQIADNAVGSEQLSQSVRDSLFQQIAAGNVVVQIGQTLSETKINFGKEFAEVPCVLVSVHSKGSVATAFAKAYSVTKTGFTLSYLRTSGAADNFEVSWLAVL